MSAAPIYQSVVVAKSTTLTLASTSRSTPQNAGQISDAATQTAIQRITVSPLGDCVASMLGIYEKEAGGTYNLLFEVPIPATTLTNGVASGFQIGAFTNPGQFPIYLPAGNTLWCASTLAQANGIKVRAEGASA